MTLDQKPINLVEPHEGPAYWVGSSLVTCKAGSDETDGRYSLFECVDAPMSGPPMHIHHREDESYFILEGTYEIYRDGSEPLHASVGAFARVPKGVNHTYKNVATTPSKMVVVASPGGLEQFFADLGIPAVDRATPPVVEGPPNMAKMIDAARRHDLEITGPPR